MNYLLDTHAFLWLIWGKNVSRNVEQTFLNANNRFHLSAVSYWEICIKVSIGKLSLADDWAEQFDEELTVNGIRWLPLEKTHCRRISTLPMFHRDPFDRMLIAQAIVENFTLVTSDENIKKYPITTLW